MKTDAERESERGEVGLNKVYEIPCHHGNVYNKMLRGVKHNEGDGASDKGRKTMLLLFHQQNRRNFTMLVSFTSSNVIDI